MGASSVTGVGNGVAGTQKGPGNGRNFFVPQVNPHVVAAGEVALVGGTATVTFPAALPLGEEYYVAIAQSQTANRAYVSAKTETSDVLTSITITGTGTDTVGWMVIKAGFGLDVTA